MVFHRILDFKSGAEFLFRPFFISQHFAFIIAIIYPRRNALCYFFQKATNKNGCSYRTAAINNLAGTEDIGKKEVD